MSSLGNDFQRRKGLTEESNEAMVVPSVARLYLFVPQFQREYHPPLWTFSYKPLKRISDDKNRSRKQTLVSAFGIEVCRKAAKLSCCQHAIKSRTRNFSLSMTRQVHGALYEDRMPSETSLFSCLQTSFSPFQNRFRRERLRRGAAVQHTVHWTSANQRSVSDWR